MTTTVIESDDYRRELTERLAESLAVCEAATEGPWEAEGGGEHEFDDELIEQSSLHNATTSITWDDHAGEVFKPADATFIAHARTGYPAALRALQAVLAVETEPISGSLMGYEMDQAAGWNEAVRHVRAIVSNHLDATP